MISNVTSQYTIYVKFTGQMEMYVWQTQNVDQVNHRLTIKQYLRDLTKWCWYEFLSWYHIEFYSLYYLND